MGQLRVDALDYARMIVYRCLERDFYQTSDADAKVHFKMLRVDFERNRGSFQIAAPIQRSRRPADGECSPPSSLAARRRVAMMIFSILSCIAVVAWFV